MVDLFGRHELVAHRPDRTPDSPQASEANLQNTLAHWQIHGFGRWLLERDGQPIGLAGATHKTGHEGLNLSYHLHPDAWGHGYAFEAAEEVVRVAFTLLKAPRVIGLARSANPASRRVLERLRFRPEGEIMLNGAPTNLWACYP